jgi:hypothetical protein
MKSMDYSDFGLDFGEKWMDLARPITTTESLTGG